jgi:hypothetical protein
MALTLREVKGSALTINEMDNNFRYFTGSHAITGSLIVSAAVTASAFAGDGSGLTGVTGEWDGSHNGNASITGSLTVTAGITANLTGSVLGTAATASFVTLAQTASYVENAQTASYVENAQTASYVTLAQTASYVENAQTASYVTLAQTASYVENAQTASYVTLAQTASFFDVVNYVAGLGEYADDAAAAAGLVPVGGLYKNGNFIQIRIV